MNPKKLLEKIHSGALKNIRFDDFIKLIEQFGFTCIRIKGSHHIYTHPDVSEFLTLQPFQGEAKPYQVRQFLELSEKYNLFIQG